MLTPVEMRGLHFQTVVFTGLAEGSFPHLGRPDPILGDAERRRLGDALGIRLPLAEDRQLQIAAPERIAQLGHRLLEEALGREIVLEAEALDRSGAVVALLGAEVVLGDAAAAERVEDLEERGAIQPR